MVRILAVYPHGDQKYGTEFFTTQKEIADWWDFDGIEQGSLGNEDGELTYFISRR